MPRAIGGWAIAAGSTVAITAACLCLYAMMIAGIVEDARLHPNVGSLAPWRSSAGSSSSAGRRWSPGRGSCC